MSHETRHLSDDQLERLRGALVHKRAELIALQRASEHEVREIPDRESEIGDVAEGIIEQEAALRLAAFDLPLLADIDRALAKLDAGTYGFSEDSGIPIPLERLDAVPWARRTAHEEAHRPRAPEAGRVEPKVRRV